MSTLSPSTPPSRSITTRLRFAALWACAISVRNAGAMKPTVKLATPPLTNCLRVIFIVIPPLNHPEVARAGDQVDQGRHLGPQLRHGAGPALHTLGHVGEQVRLDRWVRRRDPHPAQDPVHDRR